MDLFLIARFNNCIKLSGLVFAKPLFVLSAQIWAVHRQMVAYIFALPPSAINRTCLPLHRGGVKRLIYFISAVRELYRHIVDC